MTYRDDRDADRARIEALEVELAQTKRELAEARGESFALVPASGNALAVAGGKDERWYGPPTKIDRGRSFDGELPRDRFEELIAHIRRIMETRGHAELLTTSMTWWATGGQRQNNTVAEITVMSRNGKTDLSVHLNLRPLVGAMYGGVLGGVGGGGISLPIAIPIAIGAPWVVPIAAIGWLGSVFLGTRALYKRLGRRSARRANNVFEALSAEIVKILAETARTKAP
ncbi:MAG TPA: hypothetical protein VGM90_34010 [Kofleriaceae bacterium]